MSRLTKGKGIPFYCIKSLMISAVALSSIVALSWLYALKLSTYTEGMVTVLAFATCSCFLLFVSGIHSTHKKWVKGFNDKAIIKITIYYLVLFYLLSVYISFNLLF